MKKFLSILAASALLIAITGCAGGLTRDGEFDGLHYKTGPKWIELTDDADALGGNSVTYVANGQTDRMDAFTSGGAIVISAAEFPDEAVQMYGEQEALEQMAALMGEPADAFTVVDPAPEGAAIAWSWSGDMYGVPAHLEIIQGGGRMYLVVCAGTGDIADAWNDFAKTFRVSSGE